MSDSAIPDAPNVSGARLSPEHEALLARLDVPARMSVRPAAQIGEHAGDDTLVSFHLVAVGGSMWKDAFRLFAGRAG